MPTEHLARAIAAFPGRDVVGAARDDVAVAMDVAEAQRASADRDAAGLRQGIGLQQREEVRMQSRRKPGGVRVPVQHVEGRRLVAHEVVVDPVVEDQVVGAQPGEDLGQLLALEHTACATQRARQVQRLEVRKQTHGAVGNAVGVEHRDQQREAARPVAALGSQVGQQRGRRDAARAGAEHMQLRRARDLARHPHRVLERQDIGLQAPLCLRDGGVEPAHDRHLEALLDQELDQAAAWRQIPDVVLVDLRRHDEQRRAVNRRCLRSVLDQLELFVAVDDLAGRRSQVLANLELARVHRRRQAAVVAPVFDHLRQPGDEVPSAAFERALERSRIAEQRVGGRQRVGRHAQHHLRAGFIAR